MSDVGRSFVKKLKISDKNLNICQTFALCISRYFLDQPLQHLAWSELGEIHISCIGHVANDLSPSHRSCELENEILLDLLRKGMWLCVNILEYRADRSLEVSFRDSLSQFLTGRFHQR